jgi:predicted ATPase/DNA-binding SARP family transcriptional activator
MARLEIHVLGPVEISTGAGPVVLPRRLERALAVRLALAGGAPVLDDVLARDLWGDAELTRPAERLRVLASRLRAGLGDAAPTLTRTHGGYALLAAAVDLLAAEEAVARMHAALRSGERGAARSAAAEGIAQWRGPAFADLRAVPYARAEGERLDALYLDVLVERLSADIEDGRAAEATGDLERLVRVHPLHERLHRLHALALYHLGRQADALDGLARLRVTLADELGVDPDPETAQLELRLLRQDDALVPAHRRHGRPDVRLPTPATTLFGRDGELAVLIEQLRHPALVTLTGPPGSGKTRLALEVARLTEAQGRRVTWVDLAPLSEPDLVTSAVVAAAAVPSGSDDVVSRLASALDDALLVIDNAEHLIEPVAALLAAVRRVAPRLSVLVTSQRALRISAEEVHHVGPLTPTGAATLFCEHSHAPRDEQVDAICSAVDRLPLGVELAAGLTRTLTVRQIAGRIDDRLRLLVGGSRNAGQRHTSLRAALDWSYRLLDPAVATAFRRLAVFAGGCTLEAAEHVLVDAELPVAGVTAALTELCDRCLVAVDSRGSVPRFGLLESVREYALELLSDTADDPAVRARHLDWCAQHVAAHNVQGDDEAAELAAVFEEWPNLVSALENAVGNERAADGLRLAIALDDAWMFRGLHDQAPRHYAALIDAEGTTAGERAQALSNYAFSSALLGDTDLAAALLDRANDEAERAGEPELQMRILYHRGIALIEGGRPVQALEPLVASEAIARELGRDRSVAAIRDVRATAMMYAGDAQAAVQLHHDSNEMDRAADHTHGLVRGLVNESGSRVAAGDHDGALACAEEGTAYAEEMEDLVAQATLREVRGNVAAARGDLPSAIEHFRTALNWLASDEINSKLCRLDLADALLRAGKRVEARAEAERALAAMRDRGLTWLLAQPTIASLAALDGEVGLASDTLSAAEAQYAARGFGWPLAVERLDRARADLAARMSAP